ncbi:hypothetical protein QAD02_011647 [Eretmocerus hayati]|uniref:Uncharacterized protein n=1 Tax=Eretmocerus hayati TaxID=131215 RepID=A0ACC2NXI0_9HYME|nr:hypothetical protein QAD02_011647 [Eretmocerus hayati]
MSTYQLSGLVSVALVAVVLVQSVSPQPSDIYSLTHKRSSSKYYCGKNLANMLTLVCRGYFNPMFKKSSGPEPESEDDYQWSYDDSYPWRSRARANAMLGRFRRVTRGVHDECCLKSCSLNEMTSYCSDDPN